ncbi:hypothetical protein L873DRAFT_1801825 [Choiromyces venosus 120613-1]|uniref:Uncharacterized protein n=1 Tax=Choiromyces venosus 120613-1 TaxID=1336337 RepID=A0A3N4K0P3_9PEZI|nr:hypothetical protein L873DRAFT_1801825 [Choiromyces venosus 120613-1]
MPPPDLNFPEAKTHPLTTKQPTIPHHPESTGATIICLFMGVKGVPKASEKITDSKVTFYEEKPNQKTS